MKGETSKTFTYYAIVLHLVCSCTCVFKFLHNNLPSLLFLPSSLVDHRFPCKQRKEHDFEQIKKL